MSLSEIRFLKRTIFVASCALLCGVFSAGHAQQTIFNVPSTDVLDRGKVYAELDVSFKPTDAAVSEQVFIICSPRCCRRRKPNRVWVECHGQYSTWRG